MPVVMMTMMTTTIRADPGICDRGAVPSPSPPLPLLSPLIPSLPLLLPFPPLPLRSRSPLNQLGGLGDRCKLPHGGAPAENEFGAL